MIVVYSSSMLSTVLVGLFLGALLYGAKRVLTRQSGLPPGPKPIPVLGNIYDLPSAETQAWMHWFQHKEAYGPVSSVTVMGQTIVILNDAKSAVELLVKRSSIYSSRPNQVFASEMVGWGNILALLKYSSRFRSYRKAMQPCIGSESAVGQYDALQEIETHRFLFRVLKEQRNLVEHIQTEAGAIILKIAYGYTIEAHKRDPLVEISNLALHQFSKAGTPGAWLVDMIPALKHIPSWLPGAGFKRTAQAWRTNLVTIAEKPYAFVNRQMDEDRNQLSYLSNLFKTTGRPPRGSEAEFVARWTAASLYTGGADTTVCAVENFFLAMTLYPDIQRKAQDEIDRVLGPCQLPTAGDRSRLPYIDALVKEVLRWHPVAPMGIPHASSEDDTWRGYFIPQGSLILPNIWAMTHDPTVYHDPMVFKPERFLGIDGRGPEFDPHDLVFGFGRRICPARILADKTLYLNAARSLAVFDIRKAIEGGEEVDVQPRFQPGVTSHPVPWKFCIKPRSAAHEALIRSVEHKHPWEPSNAPDLEGI